MSRKVTTGEGIVARPTRDAAQSGGAAARPGVFFIPYLLARICLWILTHTIYRVHARGLENLPAEGGALLVLDTTRPLTEGQDVTIAIDFLGRAVLTQAQMVEAKVVRAGPVLNRRQTVALAFSTPVAMPEIAAVA